MRQKMLFFFMCILFSSLFPIFSHAQNFILAHDTMSNPTFSTPLSQNIQSSVHVIQFQTTVKTENGSIQVLIPASTKTITSNDGLPDGGDSISASGFDLNGLEPKNVDCRGGSVTWQTAQVTPSSQSATEEHEIFCPFAGTLEAGTSIIITIGSLDRKLINPEPITNHHIASADTYRFDIRLRDAANSIVDRSNVQVAITDSIQPLLGVGVGVTVGGNRFTLYGYTSPHAEVALEGITVSAKTTAREDGYFIFTTLFQPFIDEQMCLTAHDTDNNFSTPVCIAPIPQLAIQTVGPVLMPPTIQLSKGQFVMGENGILSGQTIPNTTVTFSLYNDTSASLLVHLPNLITPVEAFSLPQFTSTADPRGMYSLTIPTTSSSVFRVFTTTLFQDNPSPKSTTLHFAVFPWWIVYIMVLVIPLLLLGALLLLGYILYSLWRYFTHPHRLTNNRSLILLNHSLVFPDHTLAVSDHGLSFDQDHDLFAFPDLTLKRQDD